MTLLQLVQAAFKRVGLTAPTSAIGNTDENVLRMIALANEEGQQLATRHDWQRLTSEATHTTLAAESQGLVTTIAGADFDRIKNGTFWNRTQNREWLPADNQHWQQMKASSVTGPNHYFRIRGNYLLAIPTPTAGQTLAFEWVSKNWCESSGGTGQSELVADTDVLRLPDELMRAGLKWRWKAAQGLEYAEDFRVYEEMVADAMVRDGAPRNINMGGKVSGRGNVPEGSWTL